jgi:hypothetical protein
MYQLVPSDRPGRQVHCIFPCYFFSVFLSENGSLLLCLYVLGTQRLFSCVFQSGLDRWQDRGITQVITCWYLLRVAPQVWHHISGAIPDILEIKADGNQWMMPRVKNYLSGCRMDTDCT